MKPFLTRYNRDFAGEKSFRRNYAILEGLTFFPHNNLVDSHFCSFDWVLLFRRSPPAVSLSPNDDAVKAERARDRALFTLPIGRNCKPVRP